MLAKCRQERTCVSVFGVSRPPATSRTIQITLDQCSGAGVGGGEHIMAMAARTVEWYMYIITKFLDVIRNDGQSVVLRLRLE